MRHSDSRVALILLALIFAMLFGTWWLFPALLPIACVGVIQNMAFTMVSRARNSSSLTYHGSAAVVSNGVFAVMNLFAISYVASQDANKPAYVVVYVAATVLGSVFMHAVAMRVESGRAKNVSHHDLTALREEIAGLRREVAARTGSAA